MGTYRQRVLISVLSFAGTATPVLAQLSSPWTNQDIGGPTAAGGAVESGGTFAVWGAGADIWSSTDQLHFAYQRVTGDVDIRALVAGVQSVSPWTKAGVMVRETVDSRSRHASSFVTAGKAWSFSGASRRRVPALARRGGSQSAPYWVRLTRVGQLFRSYRSADGTSWTLVGSETIAMSATVYVGLAVVSTGSRSHSSGELCGRQNRHGRSSALALGLDQHRRWQSRAGGTRQRGRRNVFRDRCRHRHRGRKRPIPFHASTRGRGYRDRRPGRARRPGGHLVQGRGHDSRIVVSVRGSRVHGRDGGARLGLSATSRGRRTLGILAWKSCFSTRMGEARSHRQ